MKSLNYGITFVSLIGISAISFAMKLEPLTEEQIKPFCENKMLWEGYDLTPEQCIKSGVPCSKKSIENETDLGMATTKLMYCILEENGIKPPIPLGELEKINKS